MRKVLWIGDAAVASGFARATHYTCDVLTRRGWEVHILGINYRGDPHAYDYPIYPASTGGDLFGLGRTAELVKKVRPDVVVVQNDPWNVQEYVKRTGKVPVVASLAVDGKNCRGRELNGLAYAVFWTEFGQREAQLGGYTGPSRVIPLGVDLNVYKPLPRRICRQRIGLPDELIDHAFIVGNVNRNQPRKRMDLLIAYFAQWVKEYKVDDAFLFLHVAPTGDRGYDCQQLVQYYGIANRLMLAEPDIGQGVSEDKLALTYNCFDVQATTTQGEGFGLTTLEGMACGVPQIVPTWSALSELFKDSAMQVPCTTIAHTPNNINVMGGIADREQFVKALQVLHENEGVRQQLRDRGLHLAHEERFRWENVGNAFADVLDEALAPVRAEASVA